MLEKALKCNHYYCEPCNVTFCMYCRQPYTDDHMNPFTEHACCLFKIGSKQRFSKAVANELVFKAQIDTTKAKLFTLVGLLLWLIFGAMLLLALIPFVAYTKFVKHSSKSLEKGSYLLALSVPSGRGNRLKAWVKFSGAIFTLPISLPIIYLLGIGYLIHMIFYPIGERTRTEGSLYKQKRKVHPH